MFKARGGGGGIPIYVFDIGQFCMFCKGKG
jgi:hypothetical protein